jgi:replicative DNA helicase
MKKYCISFFNNCTDVIAKQEELSFEEILSYFNKVFTKPFTGKKNLGAMVCGSFKDNRRSGENLTSRSILTFDLDGYEEDFNSLKNEIENSLGNYTYIYYTTSSSTLIKPRARILLFIDKDVDRASYGKLGRTIAAKLFSIKLLRAISDESSFTPSQLMYLPNKVNDEFRRGKNVKELIKVDDYITVIEEVKKEDDEAKELIVWSNNLPLNLTKERVIETLGNYDCSETGYHEWFKVCQALHHQFKGSEEGLQIFTNWSLTDTRYSEERIKQECRLKYKSLTKKIDNPVTFASVIKIVNEKKGSPNKIDTNLNNEGTYEKTKALSLDLDPEIKQLLEQIKQDTFGIDNETGEQKQLPLDFTKYLNLIKELKRRHLAKGIGLDKKRNLNYTTLNSIYPDIIEYNNSLSLEENDDKPYTGEQFLEDVAKNTNNGLKTGFSDLDNKIVIQPSSLAFIAGRPSHGKTTMMLNILRNMLEDKDNKDKAFLFYSYEETRSDILIKIVLSVANYSELEEELREEGVEGVNLRQQALNQFKNYKLNNTSLNPILEKAYKKVNSWIEEGRLEILTPKSNTESLSAAIINRCMAFQREEQQTQQAGLKKEVAAVFIDYVQKLSTEEKRDNRQQEIQRICQTLLSTALDKRFTTSIILGAQVNRTVKSLDTFNLDNMRESGDIEQDANLVLGIWDEQAGKLDSFCRKLQKLEDKEINDTTEMDKLDKEKARISEKIEELQSSNSQNKPLKIKVLKNRNGVKDVIIDLCCNPNLFRIKDKYELEYDIDKFKKDLEEQENLAPNNHKKE